LPALEALSLRVRLALGGGAHLDALLPNDIQTPADKVLKAKLERNFAHRLFIGV
jgi:hypothetical protein